MSYYTPDNVSFAVIKGHRLEKMTITIPDDLHEYELDPGQRFIPHVIEDNDHPAKVGDIVDCPSFLNWQAPVRPSCGFVSRVRTLQRFRSRRGTGSRIRQIEIMGWPCLWWDLWMFEEYSGRCTVKDYSPSQLTIYA